MQVGYVDENSAKGTKVLDADGNEIIFRITDADKDKKVSIQLRNVLSHFVSTSYKDKISTVHKNKLTTMTKHILQQRDPSLFKTTTEDPDFTTKSPMDGYDFEITTTFFEIDMETGQLLVNEPGLDRDPPNANQLSFQV